eukprot:CAMPEP_0197848224 /NCGR_PEP_ID=MMETSP1438-20131217/7992_1 /TAXON_ID=1461541 /ORGANISM="Pterosperma sp., Strain CCMP1384" /LENGTH=393 /DNA_ID=CAMNT_0043460367 /DNA_START=50 /DNA_END=1231 /DNA_ORIENTATION=-
MTSLALNGTIGLRSTSQVSRKSKAAVRVATRSVRQQQHHQQQRQRSAGHVAMNRSTTRPLTICASSSTPGVIPYSSLTFQGTHDEIPQFGLGTWLSEPGKVYEATKAAIDAGYRHIDEAWIYYNEAEVGQALAEKFEEGVVTRGDMFITSKLWNNFHRPELVKAGLEESLKALGLEYLDLYLIHFPVAFIPGVDEATSPEQVEEVPLADTWKAMEELVDAGLVGNIGTSNFEIEHLKQVQAVATKPLAANQFETHPYYQRNELVNYCHDNDIVVIAHTSLGSPANVMSAHAASQPLMQDPVVGEIAASVNKTPAQVLLRWAIQRPTVVIPKSVTASRIVSNGEVFDFELTSEQVAALNGLDKPGLEGCFNHPKTPWLGRSEFVEGETSHYCNE